MRTVLTLSCDICASLIEPQQRTGARVRQRERVEELLHEAGPGDGLLGLLDDGFRERRE